MKNLIVIVAGLFLAGSALALDKEDFTQERFDELQDQGALILVDVFATWCPTCARQQTILADYVEQHPDVDLHVLTVDYDRDRATVRQLRAPRQSTLLLFKGDQQFWFSVAETREEVIFGEINRAAEFGTQ
ncbi:MAG: thioredoxin family protein [Wenzhouxiangella sp.]